MTVREYIEKLKELNQDGILFMSWTDSYDEYHSNVLGDFYALGSCANGIIEPSLKKIIKEGKAPIYYMVCSKGDE